MKDSKSRTLAFYTVILEIKEWQNFLANKTGCLERVKNVAKNEPLSLGFC